jgi:hypothetical protein
MFMPGAFFRITIIYWYKRIAFGNSALSWEKFMAEHRSNGMEKTIGAAVKSGTIAWIAALSHTVIFGPA